MIEINLLPEQLKAKAASRKSKVTIEVNYFFYMIPFALAFLLFVHVYLGVLLVAKHNQIAGLNKKWLGLGSERRQLEIFNKENASQTQDSSAIKAWLDERIVWSEKLAILSKSLLSGIWFSELSVTPKDFTLRASVVSLQKEEMDTVKKFIDNLKTDTVFFKDFFSLELSSVQTRTIGNFDVLDFTLNGTLK